MASARRPWAQQRLRRACEAIVRVHAAPGWWPASSPFEVMVGAVLVQNTRWVNVARAIDRLREHDALSPQALATLHPDRLARLVHSAGCQTVKARRLVELSRWVIAAGGLKGLRSRRSVPLRRALRRVHGVGPETADAILCFALDRPVFIADRYARRLLGRLGVIDSEASADYERCRATVEAALGWRAARLQALHGAIVRVSQSVCRRAPRCGECSLRLRCQFWQSRL